MLNLDSQAITDPARLEKLRGLRLLDTPAEPAFDRSTRLAAHILKTPIALIVLIDESRQFFKSHIGLEEVWSSIENAPYNYTVVASRSPLLIEDTRSHPLSTTNGTSGMIAYALDPSGAVRGTMTWLPPNLAVFHLALQQSWIKAPPTALCALDSSGLG